MKPRLERLEDRTTPSTLANIGGVLTYQGAMGEVNAVTESYAAGRYTISDQAPPGAPANQIETTLPGWTVTDTSRTVAVFQFENIPGQPQPVSVFVGYFQQITSTATGPRDGSFGSILIQTADLPAQVGLGSTVNVESVADPLTVITGAGDADTVNVCSTPANTGNLNGIQAPVNVVSNGFTRLTISNFTGTAGDADVIVSQYAVTGFGVHAQPIYYSGPLSLLYIIGSNSRTLPESFHIESLPRATFALHTGSGDDSVWIDCLPYVGFGAEVVGSTIGTHTLHAAFINPATMTANGFRYFWFQDFGD